MGWVILDTRTEHLLLLRRSRSQGSSVWTGFETGTEVISNMSNMREGRVTLCLQLFRSCIYVGFCLWRHRDGQSTWQDRGSPSFPDPASQQLFEVKIKNMTSDRLYKSDLSLTWWFTVKQLVWKCKSKCMHLTPGAMCSSDPCRVVFEMLNTPVTGRHWKELCWSEPAWRPTPSLKVDVFHMSCVHIHHILSLTDELAASSGIHKALRLRRWNRLPPPLWAVCVRKCEVALSGFIMQVLNTSRNVLMLTAAQSAPQAGF